MSYNKYIAYNGAEFLIEWYYDRNQYSEVAEYYENLPIPRKKKITHLFMIMGDRGSIRNIEKFRHEGDQIYAFKPDQDRFLCFFISGRKIIITNAFVKKKDNLPSNEKTRALNTRHDYVQRINNGDYYE